MENVVRVGISLEPDMLAEFDRLIEREGYPNRSEAIRDLIRKKLDEEKLKEMPEGTVVGTLTILYDHHRTDIGSRLIDLQHHHIKEIVSTLHVHIDRDRCLEVLVMRGRAGEVRRVADRLRAMKGVLRGEYIVTPVRK